MNTSMTPSLPLSKLALRLGLCAAALVGIAAPSHAAIVTFTTPISVPSTFDGLYINLLTGASGGTGASTPGWDWNPYNSGTTLSFFWAAAPSQASGVASTATGPYLDLPVGTTISSASTFAQVTAGTATAQFQTPGTHVLGFRFYNENTSAINYGYATLNVGGSNGFPLTITSWSFENTGSAITVVPEPSTWLMFSLGGLAVGALGLRRQRRERAQAAA